MEGTVCNEDLIRTSQLCHHFFQMNRLNDDHLVRIIAICITMKPLSLAHFQLRD